MGLSQQAFSQFIGGGGGPGYQLAQSQINPDEETRPECRNIGSWMQFDRTRLKDQISERNTIITPDWQYQINSISQFYELIEFVSL